MKHTSLRRGAVLIIVLGVLALLALLATTFATLQMTERQVARNYLDTVRAKLLAMSGVEHARAELERMVRQNLIPPSAPYPERYWGDDMDEEGPLTGSLDVKIENARNPSFAAEVDQDPSSGPVTPRQVKINGKDRGFSGAMSSGRYGKNAETYVLKAIEASAKIHVNEGVNHYKGNGSTTSQNLKRILNHLGNTLNPKISGLGDLIVTKRPAGGYRTILELRNFMSDTQHGQVADLLTAHTWVDTNVANPVPFTAAHAQAIKTAYGIDYYRGGPAVYRFGRGRDYLNQPFPALYSQLKIYPSDGSNPFPANSLQHGVYAMDELNPQWIEVTSRAPVNVNAARREILIALLADLKGVFMSERRRNNIETSLAGGYHYSKIKHTYSPANMPVPPEMPYAFYNVPEGDELGFLYETYPILGGTGTVTGGISAVVVADEIIACREKKLSKAVPTFDYSTAPFGGPFRSWRQFNAFCDNLVTIGVLQDPRPIFLDHHPDPGNNVPKDAVGNITGYTTLIASDFQRKVASQAIADVLKANFNPNLHPNELNPDKNLHALVDKTDLVVNSTEFIFTPTGHYDVESLGRVLRPKDGSPDALTASDNELIAEVKVQAGLQLFDLVRETRQSQFIAGTSSAGVSSPCNLATNNGKSLEVGPEPDNGQGPQENSWGGYIAFPTIGGNGVSKPSGGAPTATPAGLNTLGATIHTHLSWDCDAHFHARGNAYRKDMGSTAVAAADKVNNYPDPGETVGGPYDPVDNGGNYYRLARSFALPTASSGSMVLPVLSGRAPEDLRIDGGYNERHSGLAYWIDKTIYAQNNTASMKGVVSYWVKPNFDPARSGKPRLYMDMTRRTVLDPFYSLFREAAFCNLWNPGHDAMPGNPVPTESLMMWDEGNVNNPLALNYGVVPIKPQCLIFGTGYGKGTGFSDPAGPWGQYNHVAESMCLNHEGHADSFPSIFKGHEWTHVILSWIKNPALQEQYTPAVGSGLGQWSYKMLVNGQLQSGGVEMFYHSPGMYDDTIDWTKHHDATGQNSLRFGSPSVVSNEGPMGDNFSADGTIDEIYFWNDNTFDATAQEGWIKGRYAFPKTSSEGIFTSESVTLSPPANRLLAPASSVPPPGGSGGPGPTTSFPIPQAEIFGISWTWFAEGSEKLPNGSWVPTLTDHRYDPPAPLYPTVEASIDTMGTIVTDDGYSLLRDSLGNPLQVTVGSAIKYRLQFKLPGADPVNTILLTTPVVDDVTLYVSYGQNYTYYYYVGLAN